MTGQTPRNWNAVIDDLIAGRWTDPETGKAAACPFETIYLAKTLDGQEADLVKGMNLSLIHISEPTRPY